MERFLIPFTIPLAGSKKGLTTFEISCGDDFLACFPESPFQRGEFDLTLTLDKRTDMYLFQFDFLGRLSTSCDRCTAPIRLPIEGVYELVCKVGEVYDEGDEVVVIPADMAEINVGRFFYEFIVLSVPVSHTYDCQDEDPLPCNLDILSILDAQVDLPENEAPNEGTENPFRDLLNDLNKN